MKKLISLYALIACAQILHPEVCLNPAFDPQNWPGPVPEAIQRSVKPLQLELESAMLQEDADGIDAIISEMEAALGDWVGVPEVKPQYGLPIDSSLPDLNHVEKLWLESYEKLIVKMNSLWSDPKRQEREGDAPRLRISLRLARAFLQSYEAQLENSHSYGEAGKKGMDFLVTQQTSNGAFGYPVYEGGQQRLQLIVAEVLKKGRSLELDMTEKGYLINDLGDGGLNFDHGVVGCGLVYAYWISGDERYLNSAIRAGEWVFSRNDVRTQNFNYNCFSGQLMARLYRATGEVRYLDEARNLFEFGVLPGLMENGRWIDPHNARIQYHSVMLRSMFEYYLALQDAGDCRNANKVKNALVLGLDNLALQITTFGASNVHELLSIDPLVYGLMLLDPKDSWEAAVNININYLVDYFMPKLEKNGFPMTESVGTYLLYRMSKMEDELPLELRLGMFKPDNQ
ncbi:MAG: hypothetical protein AB3N64_08790 [Puniceicoccaceae bacterium]